MPRPCAECYPAFVTSTVSLTGLWSISLQFNHRNSNSMENIDNDFAHTRNLWIDCNNSLHMPLSWVVMVCAKMFSKVHPRWQLRNKTPSTFHLIWITFGKCLVKLAPRTSSNACPAVGSIDLRITTCLWGGGKCRPMQRQYKFCFRLNNDRPMYLLAWPNYWLYEQEMLIFSPIFSIKRIVNASYVGIRNA